MSTLLLPSLPLADVPRLATAADVALFPRRLATGDVDYELDDGRIVIVAPPGGIHAFSQKKFLNQFVRQGEDKGLGIAVPEVGVILRTNPDRLVGPDVVFVMNKSVPIRFTPEGYFATIPELVVEVRGPNDSMLELERKAEEYLLAGVLVVWVSDPPRQTVTEYST